MGKSDLFALKYRLRKTDEPVEIVAWETAVKGARADTDWVSYIDSQGNEHIMEHLTLEWDFVAEDPFSGGILGGLTESIAKMDPWEQRRYDLAKEFMLKGHAVDERDAVAMTDNLIAELKKSLGATVEDPKKGL